MKHDSRIGERRHPVVLWKIERFRSTHVSGTRDVKLQASTRVVQLNTLNGFVRRLSEQDLRRKGDSDAHHSPSDCGINTALGALAPAMTS